MIFFFLIFFFLNRNDKRIASTNVMDVKDDTELRSNACYDGQSSTSHKVYHFGARRQMAQRLSQIAKSRHFYKQNNGETDDRVSSRSYSFNN